MRARGAVASSAAIALTAMLAIAAIAPAAPAAFAGITPPAAPGAESTSGMMTLAAGLSVSGPVTLQYAASTSDSVQCTGPCAGGGLGEADYSSYRETASGKITGLVSFNVSDGKTAPRSGRLLEPTGTYRASGNFTQASSPCGHLAGSGTEVARGVTSAGTIQVASLRVTTNKKGQDLALRYLSEQYPAENTRVTLKTEPCQIMPYPFSERQSFSDAMTVDQALGIFDPHEACAGQFDCFTVTGWTINPKWSPATGGTLATKTVVNATAPPRGTGYTGTVRATQSWTLTTCGGSSAAPAAPAASGGTARLIPAQAGACGLAITSPPAKSILALTDRAYFAPQPGPNGRQPGERKLTVTGTAPPGTPFITLNGTKVPVNGTAWQAELPVTTAQLGELALKASDGTDSVEQQNTLIDMRITKPAENAEEAITAAPAMPALGATLDVTGYPGDTAGVTFGWMLQARGETVGGPGNWAAYSTTAATGFTTGTGEAWHPEYAHIIGGVGRLTVTASLPGVLDDPVASEPRWIDIGGVNPPAAVAKAFVDAAAPRYASPIRHLVCIESGWYQFSTASFNPGNQGQPPIPGLPAGWTPNPGPLRPLYGPPAGIGIAQLNPAQLISPDQYFDWKASLRGAIAAWNAELRQARAGAKWEQDRLDGRLEAALTAANVNRAAHKMPPVSKDPIAVPQLTGQQLIYQAIRYYNGQQEYHFDADYVLSATGLDVNLVPGRWVGGTSEAVYGAPPGPDGHWGPVPGDLRDQQPWFAFPVNQGYVDAVRNCQNS